jgi:hypothetical protein
MNTERYHTITYPDPLAARFGVPAPSGLLRHRQCRASSPSSITRPSGAGQSINPSPTH